MREREGYTVAVRHLRQGLQNFGDDASPDQDGAWVARVRSALLEWYGSAARDLPWRRTRDPYRILVSEMMLVQTTVTAVVPFFARFLAQFPTVHDLAAADEGAVIKAWEGLGYYRRARQLHAAAHAVVAEHGGEFPPDLDAIRALPGVGRYIAGAVLSFAFDRPAPIVEANTQRVLARWLAWEGDLKSSETQKRLWDASERLVPELGAGAFNQAFMELGALVCTPRQPMCLVCPVSTDCRARQLGRQDQIPHVTPKSKPLASEEHVGIVVRMGRVLIVKRPPGGLWENFWEFPTIHVSGADPAGRGFDSGSIGLEEGIRRLTGIEVAVGQEVARLTYGVTKHRVTVQANHAVGLTEDLIPGAGIAAAAWVLPQNLKDYPFSAAGRRLMGTAESLALGDSGGM